MEDYNPSIDGHSDPATVGRLVSQGLDNSFTDTARCLRHDGWTPERERTFCQRLAECGVVADAARAAGMSAQSAYTRRGTASGRAFHLAWEAALILARRRLSDELLSRAMNGCIEAIHRDGVIVAQKHRHDNRLAMAVLTRLDRQTEDSGRDATAARVVADEFEQYLDLLAAGGDGVRDFIAARRPAGEQQAPSREESLLARLENYRKYRVGLAGEIDVADLDPAAMEDWTEEQVERADLSGLLARLGEDDWPAAVREAGSGESNGMSQLHQLYRKLNPAKPGSELPEFGGYSAWEDEDGLWTDFPPPDDFDGEEEGSWGYEGYQRTLSAAEQARVDGDTEEALAEKRAEAEAARNLYFRFDSASGDDGRQKGGAD